MKMQALKLGSMISFGERIQDIEDPIVGIDLGTANSCIAIFVPKSGTAEIIPSKSGERTTPSTIAFTQH